MTDYELCKAVATEVMGWIYYPPGVYGNITIYVDGYSPEPVEEPHPLSCHCGLLLDWKDAGRVVGEMVKRGASCKLCIDSHGCFAAFTGGKCFDTSTPRAVFMAALNAVRNEQEAPTMPANPAPERVDLEELERLLKAAEYGGNASSARWSRESLKPVSALIRELREARAMLKRLEWVLDVEGDLICPECSGAKPGTTKDVFIGHAPDCELAKLIGVGV